MRGSFYLHVVRASATKFGAVNDALSQDVRFDVMDKSSLTFFPSAIINSWL